MTGQTHGVMMQGEVAFLLATDVAARGLDILGVEAVINFDAPAGLDGYLHRIGRTARAGEGGRALTFVEDGDRPLLKEVRLRLAFLHAGVTALQTIMSLLWVYEHRSRRRPSAAGPCSGRSAILLLSKCNSLDRQLTTRRWSSSMLDCALVSSSLWSGKVLVLECLLMHIHASAHGMYQSVKVMTGGEKDGSRAPEPHHRGAVRGVVAPAGRGPGEGGGGGDAGGARGARPPQGRAGGHQGAHFG